MANGWGGRRAGAGAPKGNNNRVRHGEYSRTALPTILPSGKALTGVGLLRAQIAFCIQEQEKLPPLHQATLQQQREWFRLSGLINKRLDQLIRTARAYSHELWIDAINARLASVRQYRAARQRLREVQERVQAGKP